MPRLIRRIEAIPQRRAKLYGEKARSLARLARAGFPVPAAFAIPTWVLRDALSRTLAETDRLSVLLTDTETSESRLAAIREQVRELPLAAGTRRELGEVFTELTERGALRLAVRSSSTAEDLEEASAAGLHETVLNVETQTQLEDAVRRCWASLFRPAAIAYLRRFARANDAQMGVVIQAMVPSEASGVMFTENPLTGDPREILINATYGLGALLVDGKVSPDTVRVDKHGFNIRDRVAGDKAKMLVSRNGATEEVRVSKERRKEFALDEETTSKLARMGTRIEEMFGAPQDVEWAVVRGRIYVLQSRPITQSGNRDYAPQKRVKDQRRQEIVWSNANVGEALPGVATPLTWSILSDFSEFGFRRAFSSVGCKPPKNAELVGNFRGRIYLNLTEAMSTLSEVPGLSPSMLLSLGGGGELATLEAVVERRSSRGFMLRLPVTASRFMRENYKLSQHVGDFEEIFADERSRFFGTDLRILSPQALGKTLRSVRGLLDDAGAVMLTCYGNFLASMLALRTVLNRVAKEDRVRLERQLLTGLTDVESAAPGLRLFHIAETARNEPGAQELIMTTAPEKLRAKNLPEGATRRALTAFLSAYGHRGPREAELSEPRWREDPTLIFVTLRALLQSDHPSHPVDVERRQQSIRQQAEDELSGLLMPPFRMAVRHLLGLVQRFARLRERLRGLVTEVLGMFREIALEAGRRLARKGSGYALDDPFYFTLSELYASLLADEKPAHSLIRRRRVQVARDQALPDPPDTFVGFPPSEPELDLPQDQDLLTGLPASSGKVTGTARVLRSVSDAHALEPGEVLVAPYADVGFAPLFTVAGAVVTDLGGPLSHASVIAREYGVPTVVNVKVGSRVIQTGDTVEVDGDLGQVRILATSTVNPAP